MNRRPELPRPRLTHALRYPFDASIPANDNCWRWALGLVVDELRTFLQGARS
jgi:hypothetical protein